MRTGLLNMVRFIVTKPTVTLYLDVHKLKRFAAGSLIDPVVPVCGICGVNSSHHGYSGIKHIGNQIFFLITNYVVI